MAANQGTGAKPCVAEKNRQVLLLPKEVYLLSVTRHARVFLVGYFPENQLFFFRRLFAF